MNPIVNISVLNFTQLFEGTSATEGVFPLAVDTYQRGFVWNDEKIRQLTKDLVGYQKKRDPKPPYYMGTVLIHKNASKKKRFIIDGQQRLTALCILHQKLSNRIPQNCALTYSPKSAQRICAARSIYEKAENPINHIFDQIVFSVISVERVDLAFTFFDTQNNRGVPLHATDLLKAYHLRAVNGEMLQKQCAQRWESIQQGKPVMSHDQEFTSSLFSKFLWRARCWTGGRVFPGGHGALLKEFQKQTWKSKGDQDTIPLYRSRHNLLGMALTLTREGHSEIQGNSISLSPNARDLPFAVRQPIHKGIGFFLYANKYAELLRWLMVEPTGSRELIRFREVYAKLLLANSIFLREVFLLVSLLYADQFGEEQLWEFSLRLEHTLGAIRLEKQQVRYETAQNFFKKDTQNLLDVISSSFAPRQVIGHLKSHHHKRDIYFSKDKDIKEIAKGEGVQGVYKQAVLTYYGHSEIKSLSNKEQWIKAKLTGEAA